MITLSATSTRQKQLRIKLRRQVTTNHDNTWANHIRLIAYVR